MLMFLLIVLVPLAALLGFLYAGRGYLAWVVSGGLFLALLGLAGWLPGGLLFVLAGLFVATVVLFGVGALRTPLVSRPLMGVMAGVLPQMSETEREALEAGTVWWDGDLFSGDPDWRKLLDFEIQALSPREREFLDGPVRELCRMLDDWQVRRDGDLPDEVLEFIKAQGFMGMIIPETFGGLGFSAAMNSAVVTIVASRSVTASVTIMVPNSLGPAELLHLYGTQEQKDHYLPRLARGEELPCFALTEPHAGSDAGSMRSRGVVCMGEWEGEEVLGIRLDWDKRYITMSTITTLIGLAFKLHDPDHLLGDVEDLGITCALVPADLPGIETGQRHDPMGVPFFNGPTRGKDVFVPIDFVIGGRAMCGKGWGMLMQCLSAGRGISLPALSVGASQLAARTAGAYAYVREQFKLSIGRFEGIEEPLARIAGMTYTLDAARRLTHGAIDAGEKPAVVSAILKAYSTEAMRKVVNDAMDVVGGSGICRGPRNILAGSYQAIPIGITVEGANILTRTMIIYGQGAIRCHPWVQKEMAAVAARDASAFDRAFFGHVGFVFQGAARSLLLGLSGGALAAPVHPRLDPFLRQLTRYSAAYALVSDAAMATLGGTLKRKEKINGRFADALAWMFLASATMKRFVDEGEPERDREVLQWSMEHALYEVERALVGILDNLPNRLAAAALRPVVFPLGARRRPPSDHLGGRVARALLGQSELREALSRDIFVGPADEPGLGHLDETVRLQAHSEEARKKLKEALKSGRVPRGPEVLVHAVREGVLREEEAAAIRAADEARNEAIAVDSFGDVRTFPPREPSGGRSAAAGRTA